MKPSKSNDEKYVRARERMRQRLTRQREEQRRTRRLSEELENLEELYSRRRRERFAGRQEQGDTTTRPTANPGAASEAPATHPTVDLCDSSSEVDDQQPTTSSRSEEANSDSDQWEFEEVNPQSDVK